MFISYAQNHEDVMLWRALKGVNNGFYIDVGANDPIIDSVTKAFYDRGWIGINIEPLDMHISDLEVHREKDVNLKCVVGDTNGEVDIWKCNVRGWATICRDVIAQHEADGYEGEFHKVPMLTLSDIWNEHVYGEVHFLKIDVEGFESSVVKGMDFIRFRPWIVLIESVFPNTQTENSGGWENVLIKADYSLIYCDGLNRFYIAKEHSELCEKFRYPPNVFDDYMDFDRIVLEENLKVAEGNLKVAEGNLKVAEGNLKVAEGKVERLEASLDRIKNSVLAKMAVKLGLLKGIL
ncbi:MAG: FkbM family methyltransferase [Candidatus Sedimenticola sp. 6PFRAG5]